MPAEVLEQIRPFLPDAKALSNQIQEFLNKGEAAFMAFVSQPVIQAILHQHLQGIMPQVSIQLCQRDRSQLAMVFQQAKADEMTRASLKKEKLDPATYEAAIQAFVAIAQQLHVPTLTFAVASPLQDEEGHPSPPPSADTSATPSNPE